MAPPNDVASSEIQSDLELSQIAQQSVYTFIWNTALAIIKCSALIYFPIIFTDYNVNSVLNPVVLYIICYVIKEAEVCWSVWCGFGDIPTVTTLVQEMFFVMTRAPMEFSKSAFKLRFNVILTRAILMAVVVLSTALGIFIVSDRGATLQDSNTGIDNVGQMTFRTTLFTWNTGLFVVAFAEFIISQITNTRYLGIKTEGRIWPKFDHELSIQLAPFRANAQSALNMFSIATWGGFLSYEFVLGTAIVSRNLGDTGTFVGMLIVGSMMSVLISWIIYMFPFLQNWIMWKRTSLLNSNYARVEQTEMTEKRTRY